MAYPLSCPEYPDKRPEPLSIVPRRTRTVPTRILVDELGPRSFWRTSFLSSRRRGSLNPFMTNLLSSQASLRQRKDAADPPSDF